MSSNSLCLGAIVIIAAVLIAHFAWRRWKRHRGPVGAERFSYATPATPLVNEAIGDLFAALKHTVAVGRGFERGLAGGSDAGRPPAAAAVLAGARQGVAQIAAALDRAEKAIGTTPPTYANYLALYRGLTSTDRTLLGAADAYVNAGHVVHQGVDESGSPGDAELGNALIAFGGQLRRVVAGVHRLGVALDVE